MKNKELESQLLFTFINDLELRNQLIDKVVLSKLKRKESQKEVSNILNISLTKIKEIENGSCKDFNAINDYINYFGESLINNQTHQYT